MPYVPVLGEAERQLVLPLLSEGFPRARIDWRSAFEAPPGANGHGMLLLVDGAAQGAILTFEKKETVRGREVRFVNISSWYIRPRYRSLAWRMMRAITSEPDTIYTICSPIPSVQRICLQLGFRYASHGSIASVPLINGLFPPAGIEVLPFGAGLLPNAEHEAWIRDHGDERNVALVVRHQGAAIPVLWQRGLTVRGLPAARLLFTSDHAALRTALCAVHYYMLRHHGIFGLYLPRIAPYRGLRGVRRRDRGPSTIVKGPIADEDVNLLYSELLYLRPTRAVDRG
jgi:hypothetical protein